jgi:ssDNA-binding Zn-finger/Zn-ribbon topoisomerase 1
MNQIELTCPERGAPMVLRQTARLPQDGRPGKFYGCSRFPACRAAHGAHPDGRSLGIPADRETKRARVKAHAAFDAHWQSLGLSCRQRYALLAGLMDLPPPEAHIGRFTQEQCEELLRRLAAARESH